MTTKSYTIRTTKNVWTFDVSLPPSGAAKVLRTFGDVTDRPALDEALEKLKDAVTADVIRIVSGQPGKRGRGPLYPEYIRGVQKPRGLGYWIEVAKDVRDGGYKAGDVIRFRTKTKAAAFITETAAWLTFKVQP